MHGLTLTGKDAKDFLQRLSTANAKKLRPGEGTRALLLNATAKVIGAFTLLELTAEEFMLVFETKEELGRVAAEFEKLHFAEALEWKALEGAGGVLRVQGEEFPAATGDPSFFTFSASADGVRWPSFLPGRTGYFGSASPSLLSADEREEERVAAGEPKWGAEYGAETNALDAGLLPWIHQNKGCYPGQEVVERSISVGHPARALVKLPGGLARGEAVTVDGKEVGKVTSVSPRGVSALGIVQWKFRDHWK